MRNSCSELETWLAEKGKAQRSKYLCQSGKRHAANFPFCSMGKHGKVLGIVMMRGEFLRAAPPRRDSPTPGTGCPGLLGAGLYSVTGSRGTGPSPWRIIPESRKKCLGGLRLHSGLRQLVLRPVLGQFATRAALAAATSPLTVFVTACFREGERRYWWVGAETIDLTTQMSLKWEDAMPKGRARLGTRNSRWSSGTDRVCILDHELHRRYDKQASCNS